MGEIKSAWELAMEKVERLGRLSPEELRRQREEKYGSIGQVLADKYLGGLALWQLEVELNKYAPEEKDLVRRALISRLIQSIELGNHDRLHLAMHGVRALAQDHEPIGDIEEEMGLLVHEYGQVEEEEDRKSEASAVEVLHRLGISGRAVGRVNPKAIPECQEIVSRLYQPYQERLEVLKGRLMDVLDV